MSILLNYAQVFGRVERPLQSLGAGVDVVVDVAPVRHERRHVQVFGEGDERRDLFVESVGMFETLQLMKTFVKHHQSSNHSTPSMEKANH